ncbi:gamma-glutamylcyclotransferase [uncultured Jatrophihabitans sp.]|uniref:gamma-glutamylcyclotransferase n=1 Tax=uncultured Jatrophihabitans sp. TaxID=1610747 RepID=UPI0035CC01C6
MPTVGRHPVLAYGSNACPSKITWLRTALGLTGPVVVLRVRTEGLAAVWASGLRVVDDQRPATLCAAPGVVEQHALWLATDDQLAVLDVCEGRGVRYDLALVRTGRFVLDDGSAVPDPLAYVGRSPARHPLLVDGAPVRCAEVAQDVARQLIGEPAAGDGLDREVVPLRS